MTPTILAALMIATNAQAATLTVDDSIPPVPGSFPTLGDAVAAASAGDTIDIIALRGGSHPVVTLDKNLTITSAAASNVNEIPRLLLDGSTATSITVSDVSLSCDATLANPAILSLELGGMELALDNVMGSCSIAGVDRTWLQALLAVNVTLTNSTFSSAGVHMVLGASDMVVESTTFESGLSSDQATAIRAEGVRLGALLLIPFSIVIRDSTFSDLGNGIDTGSALDVDYGFVTIEGSTFDNNVGGFGGAINLIDGTLDVRASLFQNNEGTMGGAIGSIGGSAYIENTTFIGNDATNGDGGAIYSRSNNASDFTVVDSTFSGNSSTASGGSVWVSAEGVIAEFRGTHFCGDHAPSQGSSIASPDGHAIRLDGVTVALPQFAASAVHINAFNNDIAINNTSFVGVQGNALEVTGSGYELSVEETLFHDIGGTAINAGNDFSSTPPTSQADAINWSQIGFSNVAGVFNALDFDNNETTFDPLFQNYVDRSTTTCADINLWLDPASPLRDLGSRVDPDGTASDIGGYGGPEANLVDADLDGVFNDLDCEDGDATISPLVSEVPYDGIDNDCDGVDLTDVDGDGHDGLPASGDDCDDSNGAIFPGAIDVWYDGVDQDCDGANDYDQDGDGYDSADDTTDGDDCNDLDADVNPGATDPLGDGVDQDCDGSDGASGTGTATGTATGGATGTGDFTGTDAGGEGSGCGCASANPVGPWSVLLGTLVLLRRRRPSLSK